MCYWVCEIFIFFISILKKHYFSVYTLEKTSFIVLQLIIKIYNENQFLDVTFDSNKNDIFYTCIEEWNVIQSFINYLKPCHDIFNA